LVFRGTLLPLMPDQAMFHFLTRAGVRLLDFKDYVSQTSERAQGCRTTPPFLRSCSCFWDNQTPGGAFSIPKGTVVALSGFFGGADLQKNVGGECTDCHAGENPYIIHPNTALELPNLSGLPLRANSWYRPLVRADWSQNVGPTNLLDSVSSTGRCTSCHTQTVAGRFPSVSTALPGYCGLILPTAYARTMPPGAVGSPDYQNHYNALTAACQQPPPPSVSPAAGDPMGYVGGGAARVVYRGTDNHVHELALTDQWYHFDMTGVPGAVPAAGDPMGYVGGGAARVVYRGTDNHVHELALTDQWYHFDMTGVPGAVPAAGDPMGYVGGGAARVVYRGTDNHVHELALTDRLRESGGARLLHSEARRGRGMERWRPVVSRQCLVRETGDDAASACCRGTGPGEPHRSVRDFDATTPATPIRQRRRAAAQPLGMTRRRSGIIVGIPPIATPRDRW
jgi:hypothetical protein